MAVLRFHHVNSAISLRQFQRSADVSPRMFAPCKDTLTRLLGSAYSSPSTIAFPANPCGCKGSAWLLPTWGQLHLTIWSARFIVEGNAEASCRIARSRTGCCRGWVQPRFCCGNRAASGLPCLRTARQRSCMSSWIRAPERASRSFCRGGRLLKNEATPSRLHKRLRIAGKRRDEVTISTTHPSSYPQKLWTTGAVFHRRCSR